MSFRQQLAKNSVNAHQAWLEDTKKGFMQVCEKVSKSGRFELSKYFNVPKDCRDEREREFIRQQLQTFLVELGFPEGNVKLRHYQDDNDDFFMTVQWNPEDATCSVSPSQTSGGTSIPCPICHEHRPAVALIPCGHVFCRDCHSSGQLRECPMCRGPITSATNGLFMD